MPNNDPSTTGGLFIGRRPGTAPLRYRGEPARGSGTRRRVDAVVAAALLVVETLVCATLWGPQPAGWLWVGAQINHSSDNVVLGIVAAFAGMILTMLLTLAIAMRLDHAWKLVRRASGYEQQRGALERIFVVSMAVAGLAFLVWFWLIEGPGPDIAPRGGAILGWPL